MWVFDATTVIYLAKVEQLAILDELDEPRLIPAPVYKEVVETGIDEGYPNARRIERLVNDDVFSIVDVEGSDNYKRLLENDSLSRADVVILDCADRRDGVAVMDEAYGRDVASVEGIETRGTAYLVLLLFKSDVIGPERARGVIDGMVDAGWYCSTATYSNIVGKVESVSE